MKPTSCHCIPHHLAPYHKISVHIAAIRSHTALRCQLPPSLTLGSLYLIIDSARPPQTSPIRNIYNATAPPIIGLVQPVESLQPVKFSLNLGSRPRAPSQSHRLVLRCRLRSCYVGEQPLWSGLIYLRRRCLLGDREVALSSSETHRRPP